MIYIVSAFVGSIAYLALAISAYLRVSRRTSEVRYLIALCISWSIYNMALVPQFAMFHWGITLREITLVCMNISNTVGALVYIIYVDFLLTFADRRPKWYWGVYGIQAIIAPTFIWHEWTSELQIGRAHYYPPPSMTALLPIILFTAIVVWGAVSLRLARRDTDSPIRRKMLNFLFLSSFLILPAGFSDMAFMLRNKGIFPFSTLLGLGCVMYFSYAIARHRFLGTQIAIRKSIIYIVLTALTTMFFFVVAAMNPLESIPLVISLALVAAIVYYYIRERLEIFIDRVMFKKSYQYQLSIERLERDIMNELDPRSFVLKLAGWLKGALGLENVDVFLLETHVGKAEQDFTTVDSDEKTKRIPGDSLLVRCLKAGQETIFRADLPVLPQFHKVYNDLDKEFQTLSAEVCVPLVTDRLLFDINLDFQEDLGNDDISDSLLKEFENNGILLSHDASCSVKERHRKWLISDKNNIQAYAIRKEDDKLNVYTGSKLGGIIVCGDRKGGKFEEEDRRLLSIAAYNIAFAVERTQLVLELKHANQFKWDLVRWLSHDLNTPLTPIKLIIGSLKKRIGENAEDQQAISVVMGEIARIQSLINSLDFIADLDTVSERTVAKQEPIDLGRLVEEVVTLFEWQARESDVTLSYSIPSDISPIRGDEDRMKQVWVNLVSNGIKYNRFGGRVEITAAQSNGNVIANIADTGIGIPESEGASIFEPFYRGEKAQATGKGGVGLGLAIVKRIVEEHGGTIQVESELDVGTSISLTIPCEPGGN